MKVYPAIGIGKVCMVKKNMRRDEKAFHFKFIEEQNGIQMNTWKLEKVLFYE